MKINNLKTNNMKTKSILLILIFGIVLCSFSQNTIELTFTAENSGQYLPLDSILIENLTQGGDTILFTPDTLLVIDVVTGIGDNNLKDKNSFFTLNNYPNPFIDKTTVSFDLYETEDISIVVRNILGEQLAVYKNRLKHGNHSFIIYPGSERYYLLTLTGKQTSKTIKLLNAKRNSTNGGKSRIVYNGFNDNSIRYKSENAINSFGFDLGDELKYIAYSNMGESSIVDSPTENQTYIFQYSSNPCPGFPTVTDVDDNVYNTVLIGSQCWMAKNLKTTTYNNNTPIPNVTEIGDWLSLTTGAYVWQSNDISWKDLYGALYNWYAIDDPAGLCPTGWHVAEDDEWTALTDFIGGMGSPHGNELKSCRQVNSPLGGDCQTTEHPRWNFADTHYGTNDYFFSAFPGGFRSIFGGGFWDMGDVGHWWTSTEFSADEAARRAIGDEWGNVFEYNSDKHYGFAVRCIKD